MYIYLGEYWDKCGLYIYNNLQQSGIENKILEKSNMAIVNDKKFND